MPADPSDDDLLQRWRRDHDEAAITVLCQRHAGAVAGACRRLGSPDPEEAAQAVFLLLARRAVDGSRLAGWLTLTARRVTADQRRALRRRRHHEHEAAMEHVRQHAAAGEPAWAEARRHLDEALNDLSAGQREAIVRFYLHGQPQATVAAELGCSVDAVKNRIHVGLERLRDRLARRGVALGAAALASGLASEAATAEPAIAGACAQAVLVPGSAAGAATLAAGVATAMIVKTTVLAAAACLLVGSALTFAVVAGEAPPPVPTPAPAPVEGSNAVDDWRRADLLLPAETDPLQQMADILSEASVPGARLPPAIDLDTCFARPFPAIDLFVHGATATVCDWGPLQPTLGAWPLPSWVGRLARLACLRARWHAGQGESQAAVDDLLASWMAGQLLGQKPPTLFELKLAWHSGRVVLFTAGALAPRLDLAQRRRLLKTIASRPPPALTANMVTQYNIWLQTWFQQLRAAGDGPRRQALRTMNARLAFGMTTDVGIGLAAAAVAKLSKQWIGILGLPAADRRLPAKAFAIPTRDPYAPYPELLTAGIDMGGSDEVLLAMQRAQLLAALEVLDHGEAGLARHPDPLTGAPFQCIRTATGMRIVGSRPGPQKRVELIIGETPPASSDPPEAAPLPTPAF